MQPEGYLWRKLWDIDPVSTMWLRNPRGFYGRLHDHVWFMVNSKVYRKPLKDIYKLLNPLFLMWEEPRDFLECLNYSDADAWYFIATVVPLDYRTRCGYPYSV